MRNNRTHTNRELIKIFAPYYRPYRKVFCIDLFMALLTTACDLLFPLILRRFTNRASENLSSVTPQFILEISLIYAGLRVLDILGTYYKANMGHVMGARIETDMRRDAFVHLQKLSAGFYNETKVGEIMSRITNDLFDVTEFAHHCPEEYFIGAVKFVFSFVVLCRINVSLTVILFVLIPIMMITVTKINQNMRRAFKAQRKQIGAINASLQDVLLGNREVKSFTNESLEREKFAVDNKKFLDTKKETYRYMSAFFTVFHAFSGLMYLVIISYGGRLVMKRQITPGDLFAYVLYAGTLLMTVGRIVQFMEQFQRGMTGIERFSEIMEEEVEISDAPGAVCLSDCAGDIAFENVSFRYKEEEKQVIEKVSFAIPAGTRAALVGPSGAGKTTLANLIPRFWDIDSGAIKIDGRDIRDYTLFSLRKSIGMVAQDVYLFTGTVEDNIRYGKPDASDSEVRRAAESAGVSDFIESLPEGYKTYIGERGIRLSGGEKQRISIARVFLKNPPILILDEATSALDNENEYKVQKALGRLLEGRTTLTIAHRLTTIKNSDVIFVLTKDGIAESGTHNTLIEADGLYARLVDMAEGLDERV